MSENALLFISGFGILQAVLLSGLLYFHPKADRSVTTFLSLYVFCLSIPMLTAIVQHFFSWQLVVLLDPFPLLLGPLVYLYVCSFKQVITWRKAWPHFIPFALSFFVDYWLFVNVGGKYPTSTIVPTEVLHSPYTILQITVRIVQMLTYYFVARYILRLYQKTILHVFSETSRINLSWVLWIIDGLLIILVIKAIIYYFFILRFPENFYFLVLLNTAIVTPYIYIITFKGLTQPSVWQVQPNLSKEKVEEEMHDAEEIVLSNERHEKPKTSKAGLNQEKIDELAGRAIMLMEQEKLYRDAELTLQDLAVRLQLPAYQVSQVLNEGVKKTFYDLVNGYRVEEAKRLLVDPKNRNHKILALGFDAGFNSKTTFNTVFKKFTGLTPSDFREQQNTVTEDATA